MVKGRAKSSDKKKMKSKDPTFSKAKRLRTKVSNRMNRIKKRHIRTSIAVVGVIFISAITMMVVYRGHSFPINWFSIVVVSTLLAVILGAVEYLYIVRVKGY